MVRSRIFRIFSHLLAIYYGAAGGLQPASLQAQAAPQSAAAPDLTIKIIEGEDGVNIIKTKSAVKPVVQVTDKNNLPVAGATVLFLLPDSGATATFSQGTRSQTVVTNSAGRAATTAMKPVGTGSLIIAVTATFQGRVAKASITQTNYLTAAAAQAAGASVGQSKGLSSSTIVAIIAGAVAAAVAGIAVATRGGSAKQGTITVGNVPVFGPPR